MIKNNSYFQTHYINFSKQKCIFCTNGIKQKLALVKFDGNGNYTVKIRDKNEENI